MCFLGVGRHRRRLALPVPTGHYRAVDHGHYLAVRNGHYGAVDNGAVLSYDGLNRKWSILNFGNRIYAVRPQ